MKTQQYRVTVFDYGAGNLHSLTKALANPDLDVRIESDPHQLIDTDVVVLPGVGAFAPAAERLEPARSTLRDALRQGLPCLGICLGMQLLFDTSEEGVGAGLGVIPGRVTTIQAARVPHIGWNTIVATGQEASVPPAELRDVYYAHSYVCRPDDTACVQAWTELEGDRFPAIVQAGHTIGVQFHPEKSSAVGVRWLQHTIRSFLDASRLAGVKS